MALHADLTGTFDHYIAATPKEDRLAENSQHVNAKLWKGYLDKLSVRVRVQPVDGMISREALFCLAQVDRREQSDRSVLELFWNSMAWGLAGSWRNIPRLVAEVDSHTPRVVMALREAQTLSFAGDEANAFRALNGKIKQLGPAFFTKFLHFTADQDRAGHALILDDRVRLAWRVLTHDNLNPRSAQDYARYCTEAGASAIRLRLRASEVEACLYHLGRRTGTYERWLLTALAVSRGRLGDRAPSINEVLAAL